MNAVTNNATDKMTTLEFVNTEKDKGDASLFAFTLQENETSKDRKIIEPEQMSESIDLLVSDGLPLEKATESVLRHTRVRTTSEKYTLTTSVKGAMKEIENLVFDAITKDAKTEASIDENSVKRGNDNTRTLVKFNQMMDVDGKNKPVQVDLSLNVKVWKKRNASV